jgi:hypothetical protein
VLPVESRAERRLARRLGARFSLRVWSIVDPDVRLHGDAIRSPPCIVVMTHCSASPPPYGLGSVS